MDCSFKRILALAPHTDDVELSAGGTVAKWVEEGKEIFYVAFSICEKSVPKALPADILEREVKEATKVLGVASKNLYIYKFEVRTFPQFRQDILEIMVDLREKLKPELVLLPSLKDVHQDHQTIAAEGIRAFKNISILGYEQPWNIMSFAPQLFVTLRKKHLDKKVQAISCYQSQKHKRYVSEEILFGLAKTRGIQIDCDYAEAFEAIRCIL
jgi:LmbE family N-acetylglucosaminyl deacetylase